MHDAEIAYLFRHALLREGAYELQLPTERARLHAIVVDVAEAMLDASGDQRLREAWALELADHARIAMDAPGIDATAMGKRELQHLDRAGNYFVHRYELGLAQVVLERISAHPAVEPPQLTRALDDLGFLLFNRGQRQAAESCFRRALEVASAENRDLLADTTRAMGAYLMMIDSHAEAEAAFRECIKMDEQAGATMSAAIGRMNLATCLLETRRHKESEAIFRELIELFARSGDDKYVGICCSNLGNLCKNTARPDEAFELYQRALKLHRKVGYRRGEALVLGNLANLHKNRKEYDRALVCYDESIAINRGAGDRRNVAVTNLNKGNLFLGMGQPALAEEMYRTALPDMRESGNLSAEARALANLARAVELQLRMPEAIGLNRAAIHIFRQLDDRPELARALYCLALQLKHEGELDAAETHRLQSLTLYDELGRDAECTEFESRWHADTR